MRRSKIALILSFLLVGSVAFAAGDDLLDQGEVLLRHGKYADALATFRKARDAEPGSLHANLGYEEAARKAGQGSGLAAEYEKRWKSDPQDPVASFLYARLLPGKKAEEVLSALPRKTFCVLLETARIAMAEGQPAAAALDAAAKACPNDARDLGLLAAAYEDAGQLNDAQKIWAKARKVAPNRIAVLVGLACVDRRLGQFDPALTLLGRAADADKEDPEIFYRLGLVHFDLKEWKKAMPPLERAIKIAPRQVAPPLLLAECLMNLERFSDAEMRLRATLGFAPKRTEVIRRLAECYELEDKNDDALKLFKGLLKANPLDAGALKGIGWIYVKKGKYDEAVRELQQAYDMDPKDPSPLFLIGYTYDKMGDWGKAVSAYEKLVRAAPDHAWGWHNLGVDQGVLGQDYKSRRSLKKAVDLDRENPTFHMSYGYALMSAKRYREALRQFEKVVKKDPKSLPGWKAVALANYQMRKYRPAAEAYEKAIKLDAQDADLHLEVGLIYQVDLGDDAKALAHYERYLVLGGIDPVVQGWVDDLRSKMK